jgi:hypothetical protein
LTIREIAEEQVLPKSSHTLTDERDPSHGTGQAVEVMISTSSIDLDIANLTRATSDRRFGQAA